MDRLMRIKEVASLLQIAEPTIYRMIRVGEFPPPIRVRKNAGTRGASAWLESDVEEWFQQRREDRTNKAALTAVPQND